MEFEKLWNRHKTQIFSGCLRLTGNPDEAHDVFQDAALRAWRGWARFNGQSTFTTWVYRICLNVYLDRVKRESKRRSDLSLNQPLHQDNGSEVFPDTEDFRSRPCEQVLAAEGVHQLAVGMESDFYEVLHFRHLDNLSYIEIAERLKIPIGTVKSRLHRARDSARKVLIGAGY